MTFKSGLTLCPISASDRRRTAMTLCPIALAVGCKKCPAFSVCPLKSVIGDYMKPGNTEPKQPTDTVKK